MNENIFGKRLRMLREEAENTCEEIAKMMGLSRSTVNHWELGRREPSMDQVKWLANHFNVTTDYLLGMSSDRQCAVYHADVNGHDVAITYRPGEMDRPFTFEDAIKALKKLESIGIDIGDLLK